MMYTCYACGLNQSGSRKNMWYLNHDIDGNALCLKCYGMIIRRPTTHYRERIKTRSCYACGNTKPSGGMKWDRYPYMRWSLNRGDKDGNVLCSRCYNKYISHPKRQKEDNSRRMLFLYNGKRNVVFLSKNPRKGECSVCKNTGITTHMHHTKYDYKNPLNNTVELCMSCHSKETARLRKLKIYTLNN